MSDRRDVTDTIRFACDLEDEGVISSHVRKAVVGLLVGRHPLSPQAVSQALVSYVVNHRRDSVRDPIDYIKKAAVSQQVRLFGKPRKK